MVFATSGILGICSMFLPSGGEHIVIYGVRWVWAGGVGGCVGDSSVIGLCWKDLIRLGRGGVGAVGGWGDSSVIELPWKDFIRLGRGRGGWGGGDSSVIELRWKDLIRSLFAFIRHRRSQTRIDITHKHKGCVRREWVGLGGGGGVGGITPS